MRWAEIESVRCSVARTLSVVGDRWTLLILREAFLGTRRFDEFRSRTGAARHLVAERLNHLVDNGVMERRQYSERPPRHEYRLTAKGRDLYPVIVALMTWGDRWMDDGDGPPVTLTHTTCGATATPALVCADCGEPVHSREMVTTVRPSGTPVG
jgi:DNA-binding HxlR family transcriptional regulator